MKDFPLTFVIYLIPITYPFDGACIDEYIYELRNPRLKID